MKAGADLPLFVYGTLREPSLFRAVAGQSFADVRSEPAILTESRAIRARDGAHPWLARGGGGTSGLLIFGLTPRAWQRIRFYEEPEYMLKMVRVRSDGRSRSAQTFWPAIRSPGPATPWRLETWRRRCGAKSVAAATRYMAYFKSNETDLDAIWRGIVQDLENGGPDA